MFAKRQPAVETVVGAGTTTRGEMNSKGTVRIDGRLEGRIRADWVFVGTPGIVAGDVVCRGMVVGGKVEGSVHAGELVDIKEHGQITGDIYTLKLCVSEGGVLEGHSYMAKSKEGEHKGVLPFASEK
jgi:cytoskeletal protein CcmA (bactofilin family)